jgi:hypothetical protein
MSSTVSFSYGQLYRLVNGGLLLKNQMFESDNGITYLGVRFGKSQKEIGNLEGTLGTTLSDPSTYQFESGYVEAYHLGITALYGIKGTDAFLLFEGEYSIPFLNEDSFDNPQGYYEDSSLRYAINFDHQQVHLRLMMGGYLLPYLNIKGGFDWGINTTSDRISYVSNDPTIGRDLAIQDELSDKLIGLNDFGAVIGFGINIPFGRTIKGDHIWHLFLDSNWRFGLSDVIRTQSNNYRLQERQNRTRMWQLGAGFRISI